MNRTASKIFFILVVTFFVKNISAQWQMFEQSGKDYFVTYLNKDTNRLLFAADNQIWTKDGTASKKLSVCKNQTGQLINCILSPSSIGSFKNELIILSLQQIHSSLDGGNSWNETGFNRFIREQKKKFTKPDKNNEIYFTRFSTTNNYIYAVGMKYRASKPYGSVIFRSQDLVSWEDATPKSMITTAMLSIFFTDDRNGWVVGQNGLVFQTIYGGATWINQDSKIKPIEKTNLNDVYFVDDNKGWAVGDNGVIIATQDGGKNWIKQTSTSNASLRRVTFINNQTGWAVGYKGTILQTNDGGKSWNAYNQGVNDLYNIYAVEIRPDDPSVSTNNKSDNWIAYVVGAKGTVLKGCSVSEICESNDLSKYERQLSEKLSAERKRIVEQKDEDENAQREAKHKENKELISRIREVFETQNIKIDVDYDKKDMGIKLSGKVNSQEARMQTIRTAEVIGKPMKVTEDDIKVSITSNQVIVTDNLADVGTLDYTFLTQANKLSCQDIQLDYTISNIGIKKNSQSPFKSSEYTERAKVPLKTAANNCYKLSNDQYLLSTQNALYLYKKKQSFLGGGNEWDLITPTLPEKLLIRGNSFVETPTNIFILGSLFNKDKFESNIIFKFNKAKMDVAPSQKEIPSQNVEYVKIISLKGILEVSSKYGKKMISTDGITWKEEK